MFDLEFRGQNGPLGAAVGQAHNQLIQALATGGIVVASCFVLLVGSWVTTAVRRWRLGLYMPACLLVMLLVDCAVESPVRGYLSVQTFMTLATRMTLRAQPPSHPFDPLTAGELDAQHGFGGGVVASHDAADPQATSPEASPVGGYWN